MTGYIKKLLIGTSVAASMSAIATAPAFAVNLTRPTNIQFTTNGVANTSANQPNINTWTYAPGSAVYDSTGIGGVPRHVLNDYSNTGNINKAIAALTDNDSATNVELFTSGEAVTDHVGFTANLDDKTIKIESVTKADWANGTLATGWLTGFRDAYSGVMSSIPTTGGSSLLNNFNSNFSSLVTYLSTNGFNSAGDPNIGDVTYNQETGNLKVDLVGHLNVTGNYVDTRKTIVVNNKTVANPNYLGFSPNFSRNSTGNQLLDLMVYSLAKAAFLQNKPFQISEIAKVTFNNEVDYAFSFAAIDSGAIAGDRNKATDNTSHTGIYSWNKTYTIASVPEPSGLVGLMAVGSLVVLRRKARKTVTF
ncbi:NF038130 family PEP-CTERM protein [Nostocaceae cyanobacterium CENA357]|uniref:NF038130 family PEP-CTERM protein n=1 Tax=Atlanticothrix silvestris CENA357 TaxID=1725252 RepID=A0A8J7HED9_9CYAN|nr:NF038130 family PEP-CTERM protein [Atlanticothrix silvestris]MBH8551350.1 NF038130 family PEP-CTERM protein [Atlanticothrix silvestris CENA357]